MKKSILAMCLCLMFSSLAFANPPLIAAYELIERITLGYTNLFKLELTVVTEGVKSVPAVGSVSNSHLMPYTEGSTQEMSNRHRTIDFETQKSGMYVITPRRSDSTAKENIRK